MTTTSGRTAESRTPLTRDRVLRAAVALADEHGIEALSMRKLGAELGVEAMSLYNHVVSKDDLLDGIIEVVTTELALPPEDIGWKAILRSHAISSRQMLLRHPWAASLAESRTQSGPTRLRHLETLLGVLRRGGFDPQGTYRANLTIDSYIYGFVLQEVAWPVESGETPASAADFVERTPADDYPYLIEVAGVVASDGMDRDADFEFGLDLVLDGLEATLVPSGRGRAR
jgi:AcrR family transcriptional regulator